MDMVNSVTEKIASNVGAWAWNEFGEGFKSWFSKLIQRKYEDAKEWLLQPSA